MLMHLLEWVMPAKPEFFVPKLKKLKLRPGEPLARLGKLSVPSFFKEAKKEPEIIKNWYLERWQEATQDNETFALRKACQEILEVFLSEWPINAAVAAEAYEVIRQIIWVVYKLSAYGEGGTPELLVKLEEEVQRISDGFFSIKEGIENLRDQSSYAETALYYRELKTYAVDLLRRLS